MDFRGRIAPAVRLLALAALVAMSLWGIQNEAVPAETGTGESPPPGPVLVATIDGAIGPATADHIDAVLATAVDRSAAAVVLRMDTPGGLVDSTRTIIRAILDSPVPVITYVAPSGSRAASAGTYIAYASHIAAMAPATNIGAATPIPLGGSTPLPNGEADNGTDDEAAQESSRDAAEAKIINDAVAYIRALAELRGRNADWAERAVTEAATLSASAAEEQSVVDLTAGSLSSLLSAIDGRTVTVVDDQSVTLATDGATVEEIERGLLLEILAIITNPNVTFILLILGVYGLIFEFLSPGSFLPGTIGVLCLTMALYALNVLPFSYTGVALLIIGLGLMTLEAFVPSFGALGIGGAIAFAFGAGMLFDTAPGFGISWTVIGVATALTLSLALFVLSAAIRSSRGRVPAGNMMSEHQQAKVVSWKIDSGTVMVNGKTWRATGNGPFEPGETLTVYDSNGRTLIVGRDRA